MPATCASLREVPDPLQLALPDQRADVQVEDGGADAQFLERLAQALQHRFVDQLVDQHARAGAAGLAGVRTIALITNGRAASRSASAKMICGLLPPSSSVTGQWRPLPPAG